MAAVGSVFFVRACGRRFSAFNIMAFLFGVYFILFPFLFFIFRDVCVVPNMGIFRTMCERWLLWGRASSIIIENLGNWFFDYTVIKLKNSQLGFELYLIDINGLLDRPKIYGYTDDNDRFIGFQIYLTQGRIFPGLVRS